MADHVTGARHPITAGQSEPAWELGDGLQAWMSASDPATWFDPSHGPFVVLQAPDGQSISIPRRLIALLARGLMAAHVDAARPDRWPA